MNTFSIIGAGKVGTSLALGLRRRGFVLKKMSDCSAKKAREARRTIGRGQATTSNILAAGSADILFICVPDSEITRVVKQISSIHYQGRFVFHTSGVVPSEVLKPLAKKGAAVASFHPVQTFAAEAFDPKILKGIFFGIEGDPAAVDLGTKIASKLGGHAILIRAKDKPVYHLACSVASNFLIILLSEAANLFKNIGFKEESSIKILGPLLNKTLQNVKKLGIERSLTGPVVRGDLKTVLRHLTITGRDPELDRIYRAMCLEALKIAEKRGLAEAKIKALKRLLKHK